jgi:hypothetical protein
MLYNTVDGASMINCLPVSGQEEMEIRRGNYSSPVIATTTGGECPWNTSWYFWELKVYMHGTNGTIELRRNQRVVLNLTGLDTLDAANAAVGRLYIYGNNYYDDIYVCDTLGGVNNDFLGDLHIQTIRPNGAGYQTDWTPSAGANYECVDDSGLIALGDYVESQVKGDIDSYTLQDITAPAVKGINVKVVAHKTDVGNQSIRPFVRLGGNNYNADRINLGDGWVGYSTPFDENPADSQPFEEADIDAMEAGLEVISVSTTTTTTT